MFVSELIEKLKPYSNRQIYIHENGTYKHINGIYDIYWTDAENFVCVLSCRDDIQHTNLLDK